MARLIVIDRPGGPDFVDTLSEIWEAGDAAFPVDQRLPPAARNELCRAMRVGDEVEAGDALVIATSGSTGAPKGVVLTHDAVAASATATSRRLDVGPDDHWLACLPLAHVGGLSVVTRSLHTGTRLTVHAGFDAASVMSSGATMVSLVATALSRIDPSIFRTIVLGGSRPPADRPTNTVTTYGMTETGSGVVYEGRPLDGVEVDIGGDGEIRVRCPMLLRCYRDGVDPKDADGWFATGDLGEWRDDGRLHVLGRRGDLIITGGENVWPEAVEAALRSHPDVADVMVRGAEDAEWGQVVEAVVVPTAGSTPTLDALRGHVKEHHAAHLAPKRLVVVDAVPRTALGKPIRR
ncbi:class I adenylate-forming enzyme family protein [Ilumatobacter nonamiensis]|uniref:class I adenylate-forming enzyme family protein n=1 Tax=Ilumatobacter nonamiensis TaxID=467093 RepID=UPI0003477149|nr:fatty acid--CoA ligase family protein [Ilumatobacter nonamiensis]